MYFNGRGEAVSRARWKEMYQAFLNRQELIKAGLTSRRDLLRMGLLGGAGMLIAKNGLSSWGGGNCRYGSTGCGTCASPPTTPWTLPMPIPPVKQAIPVSSLTGPAPSINPNTAINPATSLPYEGRTRAHQAPALGFPFPAGVVYQVTQQQSQVRVSNELPMQNLWTFDGVSPGPTYVAHYGTPVLVRNINNLPVSNGGFGLNSVSTHLHNSHTPSESDGFPCDFFAAGQYYDQYYPNALAGFNSTHVATHGDINESLSTLWYHDHRENFTSQNVYKGLLGFYLLFNQFDTGDETTGFRLPSFPNYDIPMAFADRCFDAQTGMMVFDTFNTDGILGDKFLVNGVIQPVLHVSPRRYRFRWLNTGPSRFLQVYLTDLTSPSTPQPFYQISNDGNLLPHPVQVPAVAMGVAERSDVIIDFSQYAGKTLYLENRLDQPNGQGGPTGSVVAGGQGFLMLKIIVDGPVVADNSINPATLPAYYALPSVSATPRLQRSFNFDQTRDGQWTINGRLFSCASPRFTIQQNSLEEWAFDGGFGWSHPIHVHFEEFQITQGAPGLYGSSSDDPSNYSRWGSQYCWSGCSGGSSGVNVSRKDTVRVIPRGNVKMRMRFRDWLGRYPMHCHNVIHEDHAMMLRFDVATTGDMNTRP
ncbi:MAG: multicopper oxidase domain-containing protein [Acidobacteria bacterium]|nr:multicopper oxidase domain-containing protein [Acidobacteriota bacterium]MBV9186909.1 multicopper oxidase domain-containing protein [Acidobacteriota bacterium]